jgi:hypothetical protein
MSKLAIIFACPLREEQVMTEQIKHGSGAFSLILGLKKETYAFA